jgi:solute:Na+ symporter, SSS family
MPRDAADDVGRHVAGAGVEVLPPDQALVRLPANRFARLFVKVRSINSQWLYFFAMVAAIVTYVVVSLAGRQVFDMDRMLHRGKYAIKSDVAVGDKPELPVRGWRALIGITPEFTRADRFLYYLTLYWSLGWIAVFFIQLAINLVHVQSDGWWLNFYKWSFYIQLAVGFIATFWIGWGGIRDMVDMFRTLKTLKRNDADDGRVADHRNVGEEAGQ